MTSLPLAPFFWYVLCGETAFFSGSGIDVFQVPGPQDVQMFTHDRRPAPVHVFFVPLRIQVPSEKVFGVGLEGPSTF